MNNKYHTNENHIKPMLEAIERLGLNGVAGDSNKRILKFAAIFHDCFYRPDSLTGDNEKQSLMMFKDVLNALRNNLNTTLIIRRSDILVGNYDYIVSEFAFLSEDDIKMIEKIILNTIEPFNKRDNSELEHFFYLLDLGVLNGDFEDLVKYEHLIYNEYKNFYPLFEYIEGRTYFLSRVIENGIGNKTEIEKLMRYVNSRDYGSLGVFAGSFNPFTIGHKNILDQASKHFNQVIVAQLMNPDKPAPAHILPELDALCVRDDSTLIEFIKKYGKGYTKVTVIRGLRSGYDLQYEQNFRSLVKDFENIDFVYFLCDAKLQHISSSMVRSLTYEQSQRYMIGY